MISGNKLGFVDKLDERTISLVFDKSYFTVINREYPDGEFENGVPPESEVNAAEK